MNTINDPFRDKNVLITGGLALPATEAAAAQIISLPMYPELTPAQVNTVAGHLLAWADTNPAA